MTITERTRKHFADLCRDCIAGVERGDFYVNDIVAYVAWQAKCIRDIEAGQSDHTFTFRQMVHYFETGECVPLLAPERVSS